MYLGTLVGLQLLLVTKLALCKCSPLCLQVHTAIRIVAYAPQPSMPNGMLGQVRIYYVQGQRCPPSHVNLDCDNSKSRECFSVPMKSGDKDLSKLPQKKVL